MSVHICEQPNRQNRHTVPLAFLCVPNFHYWMKTLCLRSGETWVQKALGLMFKGPLFVVIPSRCFMVKYLKAVWVDALKYMYK